VRVTLDVGGFAPDCCGGEDEVEHLVEPEVGADLVCLMRGEQLWSPGGEDAVAAVAEDGVGGVGVPEELGRDRVLAVVEQCEAPQPGEQHFPRWAGHLPGCLAQVVDLSREQRFEQLAAALEVSVEGGHADSGSSGDFGHRHLGGAVGVGSPALGLRGRRGHSGQPIRSVVPSKWTCSPLRGGGDRHPPVTAMEGPPLWSTGPWAVPGSASATSPSAP